MRSYLVELDPNRSQETAFRRYAGAARWAYNWGLRRRAELYRETNKWHSFMTLHKELTALKHKPEAEGILSRLRFLFRERGFSL